ncbi:hypothetical protein DFA_01389 [Cavenderia fasciculata]|uniref:Carbohydrate binding domain-containing protein n=1 Tax=Cavenderia fasciculata TaxID=261658 RepID=F4PSH3_CACFS|nr:uncharacterized protein DFA_01389 [Cavenderia fasciculata]EGG21503.1 hypothetical protein DFA_01389 [Cavenderia fasciculata]|eukprot:XP_004359353.1 hypothetical protein DFA_01389 [Cavenderia fasciculata]
MMYNNNKKAILLLSTIVLVLVSLTQQVQGGGPRNIWFHCMMTKDCKVAVGMWTSKDDYNYGISILKPGWRYGWYREFQELRGGYLADKVPMSILNPYSENYDKIIDNDGDHFTETFPCDYINLITDSYTYVDFYDGYYRIYNKGSTVNFKESIVFYPTANVTTSCAR